MVTRLIQSEIRASRKSILLLGPRQVGKSTLISGLAPELEINLADELDFLKYSSRPEAFRETIEESRATSVYVDEIQRLPALLNTIQSIADKNKALKFYLTGSSARKLKRGQANLLPGRVVQFRLGGLVAAELEYGMSTAKLLTTGALPEPYLSNSDKENARLLRSYAAGYLKEEIRAESLVRNLDSFARFFQEATSAVADFVDYTKLAHRAKISRHAVPRYFEILEDTLIGHLVGPHPDTGLDLVKHPKFYFFDNGVYNGLLGNFVASADRIGKLAEQLVFTQLLHSAWARELPIEISTFRTRSGVEVDFVVRVESRLYGIEVKASDDPSSDELEGLRFFDRHVQGKKQLFVLHMGRASKKRGDVWCLPWQEGLREMGL